MDKQRTDTGTFGRIPPEERFWTKVDKSGDCWLWTGPVRANGYGYTTDFWKKILAHRFAYELTHGPIPEGKIVCHSCDNRACVRPDHLFLGSYSDNTQDMRKKGRHHPAQGETHVNAKLTEAQVREIRAAYIPRPTIAELAAQYGVSDPTIRDVINRVTWKHVD